MFRQPLWDVRSVDSQFLGDLRATNIPVLDIHELAAGKLCALMARQQGRDLFDSHQLLNHNDLKQKQLRLAFVVYGAMNRKDWRTVSLQDIDFAADELSHQLLPLFHLKSARGDESPVYYGKGNRDDRFRLSWQTGKLLLLWSKRLIQSKFNLEISGFNNRLNCPFLFNQFHNAISRHCF